MKKLFVFLLLSLSAFALTPISDTVYTATGSTALPGSYLLIKWPRFASGANHPVLPNAQTVQLTNGVFRVSLEPTATAQHPFHYIVEYHLISANGPLPTYIETWDVPDTSAPQTIASVLVTSPTASGPPPLAKGDLATSDGVTGLVLHSPQQAGYILLTDPTAPTGLTYQPLTSLAGNYDAAGAAVAAQTAAEVYTDTFISRLGSAAQHAATDFDIAGLAVAAQASAKTYTDNAIATVTAGAITGAQMNTAIGTAIASLPTSGSSQTKPALLTAADWAVFNAKQAALGFTPLNPANNLSDLANTSTALANLGLGSAATQSSSAFDAAGSASNAVAAIPTSSSAQTKPALITPADWATFNGKQGALTVTNDTNVTGTVSGGGLTLGWTGTLAKTRLLSTTVFTDQANTFASGRKQTFTASSTTAGLNLAQVSVNPSSLANGDVWMRSDLSHILFYAGSALRTVLNSTDVLGYSTQSGLVGTGSNYMGSNTMICLDANSNVSTATCNPPVPAPPTSSTLGGVKTINCGAGSHMNSLSTAGVISCTADSAAPSVSFKSPYLFDQTNYYIPEDAMSVAALPAAVPSMAFLTGTPQSPAVPPTPQTNGDVIMADTANGGPYYWGTTGSSSIEAVMTFGGGSAPKMGLWVWDSTLNKMYIFPISQGVVTMTWQTATYNGTTMGAVANVNNVYVPLAQTAHLKLSVNSSTGFITLQQTINAGGYWNTLVNSNQSVTHPAQFGIMFSSDTIDVKSLKIQ